jgi:hypothetical protein
MDPGSRQMFQMIVPTLCVGMQPVTLRVTAAGTQSVPRGIPTQSVGTINGRDYAPGTKCFCAVPRAIKREM